MKTRRTFLKLAAGAGAGALLLPVVSPSLDARENKQLEEDHIGMLYDSTLCIGCKACEVACKDANNKKPELNKYKTREEPRDLSWDTLNIIKMYKKEEDFAYIKRQCMHCVDPSCVSGCPTSALRKGENGVVMWHEEACIGCRYCVVNCPFNIPKFDWETNYSGIAKCNLCEDNGFLKKHGEPACTEICPTHAVKFGKVKDLLAEAKNRLQENPDQYVDYIYGEKEGGGTSVLVLSHVPYKKLGLPELPEQSAASNSETIQHGIYKGMIAPAVIVAGLIGLIQRNRKQHKEE